MSETPQDPNQPQWNPTSQPPPGQPAYGQQPYGQPSYPYQPPVPDAPASGKSIVALILGVVSIMLCLGIFTGIPAIIVGRQAMKESDASQGRIGGRGLALGGVITGAIGSVLATIGVGLVIALFAFSSAVETSFEENCETTSSGGSFSVDCG